MKLCIPVLDNTGLQAVIESHFPQADTLLVFDTESRQHHYIDVNSSEELPAEQTLIDAVLCSSINRHTLRSLLDQGIQVFGTTAETAIEAITQFENGELEAVAIAGRHRHGHGHAQGGCGCHGESAAEDAATEEHACCGGHGDEDHECCGGQGHGNADHECCGGGDHGHGGEGCGCHGDKDEGESRQQRRHRHRHGHADGGCHGNNQ